jgi:CheY-like chemotaxis protein
LTVNDPSQRCRVLVADDEPVSRVAATRLLERLGHAVSSVDNGTAAIAALARQEFDLLLLDVEMPGLDGFKVARAARVREEPRCAAKVLWIVALSAHTNPSFYTRCRNAGIDAVLTKPIDESQLRSLLARIFPR